RSLPEKLGAVAIRRFDGDEPTRDNLAGRLPELFQAGGLVDAHERDRGAAPAHALECKEVFSKIRQSDPLAPFVVGDSVTVPAGDYLGEMGFAVDAVACRTFAQGIEVMSARTTLP